MNTELEQRLQQLEPALTGPDTAINRLLGNRSAEQLRLLIESPPPAVSWIDSRLHPTPLELEPQERRLVQAFAFLLTENKKSTPRLEKMQDLYAKYQSEDLAEMLLTYYLLWYQPAQIKSLGYELLLTHPDSLGLRLHLALLAVSRDHSQDIKGLLDEALDWPDFQALHPDIPAYSPQIRLFHTISCLFFAHQQQFQRALFAYAVCRDAQASQAELLTLARAIERQLNEHQAWEPLMQWLTKV